MNFKGILFFLGIHTLIVSFFSFINILYSIYFNFNLDFKSYIILLSISLILGLTFCFFGYKNSKDISIFDQILLILIGFIFLPLLISIPYFFSIYNYSFLNSYFESVSGFTATGFSIIKNIEELNEPLILWRSSSQWVGGLFFLIAIIGTLGAKKVKIKPAYLISGGTGTTDTNLYNNFNYNFIKIALIYSLTTILIISIYNFADIRFFDSFNLSFTIISSGGFLSKNQLTSIATSEIQILILSLTLLIPILNFYFLYKLLIKEFKLEDHYEDLHLIIIIFLSILSLYFLVSPKDSISSIILAVISSISTSGITIYNSNIDISLFFILLTIIGGSLISTSSGIKYVRFYILLKISYQEIYKLVKPINVFNKFLFHSNTKIDEQDSKIAFLVFISFIVALFFLSGILTLDNISFENSFKLSILTLTNTVNSKMYGLNDLSFFDLNSITKISLITFMILAKIEIITILYLIKKFIFKV